VLCNPTQLPAVQTLKAGGCADGKNGVSSASVAVSASVAGSACVTRALTCAQRTRALFFRALYTRWYR